MDPAPDYNVEELMAVVLSRQVRDFETTGVGAASPIPAAGAILAAQTHAPHANLIILGSREFYPFQTGSSELHFLAQRGDLDLFFLSCIQVDRRGNFNLHVIGDYESPSLRMAGAYGSGMLYYMAHRVILFRTEHTRRTFVEKVDFITGAGVTPENFYREGGPAMVVTPKAVVAWDKAAGEWVLETVHGGSSVVDVRENTGFELRTAPQVGPTAPPSPEELRLLRTVVREKLKEIYPDFARTKIKKNETV